MPGRPGCRPDDSDNSRRGRGGVFHHKQIVPARNSHDGVHVGRLSGEVDRNHGAGARRDGRFDGRGSRL